MNTYNSYTKKFVETASLYKLLLYCTSDQRKTWLYCRAVYGKCHEGVYGRWITAPEKMATDSLPYGKRWHAFCTFTNSEYEILDINYMDFVCRWSHLVLAILHTKAVTNRRHNREDQKQKGSSCNTAIHLPSVFVILHILHIIHFIMYDYIYVLWYNIYKNYSKFRRNWSSVRKLLLHCVFDQHKPWLYCRVAHGKSHEGVYGRQIASPE